jgi:mannitol/fructose-specific phosphotransferase system IIA component (Ntr-type)
MPLLRSCSVVFCVWAIKIWLLRSRFQQPARLKSYHRVAPSPFQFALYQTTRRRFARSPFRRFAIFARKPLTARMWRAILVRNSRSIELINTRTIESLRSAAFVNPLTAGSEMEAIEGLLNALRANPLVTDLAELKRAIIERQKVDPPFLPMGVAFPHARTDSVKGIMIVIGISPQPIPFSAGSARLVLLIGVPKKAVAEYLELTSFLARHLRGENVLDRLMSTKNIEEFLAAFAPPS